MPVFYLPLMGLYRIKSIALVLMPLLFVCAASAIIMVRSDKMADFIFAQAVDLNNSNKLTCNNINLPANLSLTNDSISLQNLNSTNGIINSMNKNYGSPPSSNSSVTTGSGEIIGKSKPVKPTPNPVPQNMEPERLVPNPQAFEEAKNAANSPCPPESLIKPLGNKNVIEPQRK